MKKADRQLLMLLGVAVCIALVWWAVGRGGEPGGATTSGVTSGGVTTSAIATGGGEATTPKLPTAPTTGPGPKDPVTAPVTPVSGLDTIAESQLPAQGRDTLALIRAGGPYPYSEDDGVFENRERILQQQPRGYYREYTVETPGSDDRGARRIIGGAKGDRYYTDDHYDSFRQILEGE